MDNEWKIGASIIVIIALTTINVLRAKFGEIFSVIFTALKIAGILIIIAAGLFMGSTGFSFSAEAARSSGAVTLASFGVALSGVLFSYGGWQHASFLAGETKNPARNVPIAMITGALVVIAIYILVNISYMMMMPVSTIASSEKVAAEAISTVLPFGGMLVAAIIAVSTLGTIGIFTLSAPRIYYAMAEDGLFFKGIARVHPKFKTPVFAIITQSVWSIILLLFWGTFDDLITYTISVEWMFFGMAAFTIFIFRKRHKDTERPYKTPAYPLTPVIFIGIIIWFVGNIMINKPLHSGISIGFLLLGLPFYFYFKRKNRLSAGLDKVNGNIED
jgi:APA family basic amino acid/polyamine antiporter